MIAKLKAMFASFEEKQAEQEIKQHDLDLCSFALMTIVAQIDNDFSEDERQEVLQIGKNELDISEEEVQNLLDDAKQHAKDSTSLYEYTELIHRHFDEPSKFQLIYNLWRIAYADGNIDRYEEHIIRKIAELIYLEHPRFIEAKLKAKES